MTLLFQRDWAVQLGTLRVTGLDVAFNVRKTSRREPNTVELSVYNLSAEHRREVEQGRNLSVQLWAGYKNPGAFLIFSGDIRDASTARRGTVTGEESGADSRTVVEAEDGGTAYRSARVSRSFPPGTTPGAVLRALAAAMGVGVGNLAEVESMGLEGAGGTFSGGTVLDGPARSELDGITRSMGLRWSIQNGVLQFQRRRTPLQQTAVRLAPGTGLVGTPAVDDSGLVTARALIVPGLEPGRRVVLESADHSGGYEVRAVEYSGDTAGGDWYADLELRAY